MTSHSQSNSSTQLAYQINQATEVSGLGRSSLYAAMDRGELAFLKIGKRRLILRDDLVDWLKTKRRSA